MRELHVGDRDTEEDVEWFQHVIAQYGFDDDTEISSASSSRVESKKYPCRSTTTRCNITRVEQEKKKKKCSIASSTVDKDASTTGLTSTTQHETVSANSRNSSRRKSARAEGVSNEKSPIYHNHEKSATTSAKRSNRRDAAIPRTLDLTLVGTSSGFDEQQGIMDRMSLFKLARRSLLDSMKTSKTVFSDLKEEFKLLTTFHASSTKGSSQCDDGNSSELDQTLALLKSILQHAPAYDYLFDELLQPLLEEVGIMRDSLCGAQILLALCRIAFLSMLLTVHIQRYSVAPKKDSPSTWCQRSETVDVTLFEMLDHATKELFSVLGTAQDKFQTRYQISNKLKSAWRATGHTKALETILFLYDDGKEGSGNGTVRIQRESIFSEICCEVLNSMDQWCPAHPQTIDKFLNATLWEWPQLLDAPIAKAPTNSNTFKVGGGENSVYRFDSDSSSGLYSDEKMAPVPKAARDVLSKALGSLLLRQDVVERVMKRILPFHRSEKSQDEGHCSDTVSSLNTTLSLEANLKKSSNTNNEHSLGAEESIHINWHPTKKNIVAIVPSVENCEGVGTTTVAALVAHRPEICKQFTDGVVWLSFRRSPGARLSYTEYRRLLGNILQQVQAASANPSLCSTSTCNNADGEKDKMVLPEFPELIPVLDGNRQDRAQKQAEEGFKAHCFEVVAKFLSNKRILLVLDNIPDIETLRWFHFSQSSSLPAFHHFRESSTMVTTPARRLLPASATVELDLFSIDETVDMLTLKSVSSDYSDISRAVSMAKLFHPVYVASVCKYLNHYCCCCPCDKREANLKKLCSAIEEDVGRDNLTSPSLDHTLSHDIITPRTIWTNANSETRSRSVDMKLCFTAFVTVFCNVGSCESLLPEATAVPAAVVDCFFHLLLRQSQDRRMNIDDQRDYALLVRKDLVALGFLCLSLVEPMEATRQLRIGPKEGLNVGLASSIHKDFAITLLEREYDNSTKVVNAWNKTLAESLLIGVRGAGVSETDGVCTGWKWTTSVHKSPMLAYALNWLPIHLIRSQLYHETVCLLETKSFIHDRLFCLGVEEASERLVHDMYSLLTKLPGEDKDVAKRSCRLFGNILTQMLQQECNDRVDGDEKKEDNLTALPGKEPNKDELKKIGRAFLQLAISQTEIQDWEAVLPFWQCSLAAFSMSCGRRTETTATIFYNIGMIYGTKLLNYDEAIHHLTQCLTIRRTIHGEDHVLCAQALGALSDAFVSIGEYEDAKTGYKLARDLLRHRPRLNREQIGHLQERLGDLNFKLSDNEAAVQCYQSALLYKKAELGEGRRELYRVHNQLGLCYAEMDRHGDLALKHLEHAIQLLNGTLDSREEANLLQMRGMASSLQDRRDESLGYYQEALNRFHDYIATTKGEPLANNGHVAPLLHSIGCVYLGSSEYPQALHFFQESLNARRDVSGQYMQCSLMEVSTTLFSMAQAHETQGEFDEAFASLNNSLKIRVKYSPDSEMVAITHEAIASVARSNHDTITAQASLKAALELRKKLCNGDENHESVVSVIRELSSLIDELW